MKFTKEQGKLIQVMSEIQSRLLEIGIFSLNDYLETNFLDVPVLYNEEEEIEFEENHYGYPLVHYIEYNQDTQEIEIKYVDELFEEELEFIGYFNENSNFENIVVYSLKHEYMFIIDEDGIFFVEEVL